MARTFGKDKTTPFFAYSFAAHLTHDESDQASKGDEVYLKFLQDLVATDSLDNTVILWFSDHGPRFGPIRESYHGRIETSTPYLFFTFPAWFHKKYPQLINTLKLNQNRLSSHFDVYATLREILYFNRNVLKQEKGKITERAISLFREIPAERTCEKAGIPGEFCACGRFSKVSLNRTVTEQLGMALLDRVNSFVGYGPSVDRTLNFLASTSPNNTDHYINTAENVPDFSDFSNQMHQQLLNPTIYNNKTNYKHLCTRLALSGILGVYFVTNDQLRSLKVKSYRVTIRTTPGLGLFEGLVNHVSNMEARVVGDVVRINLYRGQANCVHDPWLRQFCFCTN